MLAEINVVPFVDVVLVLLIVFMAVSPIILHSNIKVDLPQIKKRAVTNSAASNQWVVTLNTRGKVFLTNNSRNAKQSRTPITTSKLHTLIHQHLQTKPLEIYIRADKGVLYEQVVQLMDAMEKAGVSSVGLVTQPL